MVAFIVAGGSALAWLRSPSPTLIGVLEPGETATRSFRVTRAGRYVVDVRFQAPASTVLNGVEIDYEVKSADRRYDVRGSWRGEDPSGRQYWSGDVEGWYIGAIALTKGERVSVTATRKDLGAPGRRSPSVHLTMDIEEAVARLNLLVFLVVPLLALLGLVVWRLWAVWARR